MCSGHEMASPRASSLRLSYFTARLEKFVVVWITLASFCTLGKACPDLMTCGALTVNYPFSCSLTGYQLDCSTSIPKINLDNTSFNIMEINSTAHTIILGASTVDCETVMHLESNGTYIFLLDNIEGCPAPGLPSPVPVLLMVQYIVPNDEPACGQCLSTNGSCAYNSISAFQCIRPDCRGNNCRTSKKRGLIVGLSVGGSILIVVLLGVSLLFSKTRKRHAKSKDSVDINPSIKEDQRQMQRRHFDGTPIFTYKELSIATNSFSDSRFLGGGGFSTVYKGILPDGQFVAVKKLNQWNKPSLNQFYDEVNILSKVRHPNLVQLHGCCIEGRELLLVFEFVPNGTLANHLHGNTQGKGLSWATRLRIATQTAQALTYLHESASPPILHRDVKATNILLDDGFHAKVGDFGLSRLVPLEATHISTAPQGTPGYLDPEYYKSYQLTDRSDVYSLGVLLMELISGKKAVDLSRDRKEINLSSLAIAKIQSGSLDELIDPNLGTQFDAVVKQMVTSAAELAFCCLSSERDNRPCMREVAEKLEQILQLQEVHGSNHMRSHQELSEAMLDNSQTHLLMKLDLISPMSVIETKWIRSNDSSSGSI